jgi:hypothetical protein
LIQQHKIKLKKSKSTERFEVLNQSNFHINYIMTKIIIPMLQLAVVVVVETLLLSQITNAFTIQSLYTNPLSTTPRTTPSFIRSQQSVLYVKQKSHSTTTTTSGNKEPLFDIIEKNNDEDDGDNDLFQINYNVEDDYDEEEEDEFDDYIDQGQSYTLDYDDDDDDDNDHKQKQQPKQHKVVVEEEEDDDDDTIYTPTKYSRDDDFILTEREDRLFMNEKGEQLELKEKCILVAVENVSALRKSNRNMQKYNDNMMMDIDESNSSMNPEEWSVYFTLEESMNEMKDLIRTCGMELVGEVTQRLNEVNPKTYIGTGKVKETLSLLDEMDSCTVVFDAELTPGQQKHLENAFNKKVIQNDFMGSEQIVSCFRIYLYFC